MTRINLLPWREELREQRRKAFVQQVALVLLATAGAILVTGLVIDGHVDRQRARNELVEGEITRLETRIAEIDQLEQQRERLLARMRVIQDLQGTRPVIVRMFDQLVRTLPDGVFYQQVALEESQLAIEGIAEANNRISALMRELDDSEWLKQPNLKGLKEASQFGDHASRFNLTAQQTAPSSEGAAENEES